MEKEKSRERMLVEKRPRRFDLAHLIKWIVLIILVVLVIMQLYAGEMQKLARADTFSWVILAIKLLLIIVIIFLMRVQRCLKCKIIEPDGCTPEETDMSKGLFVEVHGTATGSYFSHYTLAIKMGGSTMPVPVEYPGGGGSGASPVSNGFLGKINTLSLMDGGYEVVLTVYPYGSGSPKVCKKSFTLLKAVVYISRVAGYPTISNIPAPGNANPFDQDAELCKDDSPEYPKRSFGGNMSMDGAAYIYECPGRKIKSYAIRYAHVTSPGSEPSQPATDTSPPSGVFSGMVAPLPLVYLTDKHYQTWTRLGIEPGNLINSWKSFTLFGDTYPKFKSGKWNSKDAGSGRYSLLLTAEDTAGHKFHDIQHIWLDNHNIIGEIVKFQAWRISDGKWEDLPKCKDVSMKLFSKIRVMGLAWDNVIDDNWWPPVAPNDNFDHFDLKFKKQFGSYHPLVLNVTTRVPALPATAPVTTPGISDAGELAEWNLHTMLDAGVAPSPYVKPPDPQIYHKESCTYTIRLFVTDNTVLNESNTHHVKRYESIKIVNDL